MTEIYFPILDEEEPEPEVDTKKLRWMPWFWHFTKKSAKKTLAAADYVGEKLAYFVGITSPKYQYEIDEYNRLKWEEEKEKEREDAEREKRELEGEKNKKELVSQWGEGGLSSFSMDKDDEPIVKSDTQDKNVQDRY